MLRFALVLALAVLLTGSALAQDSTPGLARAFTLTYAMECGADWGLSWAAVNHMGYRELMPLGNLALKSPAWGFAFQAAEAIVFAGLTDVIFRASKPVGWAFVVLAVVVKGYVVMKNIGTLG